MHIRCICCGNVKLVVTCYGSCEMTLTDRERECLAPSTLEASRRFDYIMERAEVSLEVLKLREWALRVQNEKGLRDD